MLLVYLQSPDRYHGVRSTNDVAISYEGNTMKYLILIIGAIAILLGGLWTLQGLGVLSLEPIYCVADCETIDGFTPKWAIIGFIVFLGGILATVFALRR